MKYLLSLIIGFLTGVALFAVAVVYNPFISQQVLSPLAVTDAQTVTLSYSGVAADGIIFTNNGESRIDPHPEKVLQLWEASIRKTSAKAVVMRDGRNRVAGIGIKLVSASEESQLLAGKAQVDSVWYVYLPGRGSFFVEQTENYWSYIRDIVVPAYRSSADTWTGSWLGNMTSGPAALGMAKVTGGSGEFAEMEMLGVESMTVRTWRVDNGLLAAEGRLIIELPTVALEELPEDLGEETE